MSLCTEGECNHRQTQEGLFSGWWHCLQEENLSGNRKNSGIKHREDIQPQFGARKSCAVTIMTTLKMLLLLLIVTPVLSAKESTTVAHIGSLIRKYSNVSTDFLSVNQLQKMLDKLNGCSPFENATATNMHPSCDDDFGNCNITRVCLSAEEVLRMLNVSDGKMNGTSLETACPILLSNLDGCMCHMLDTTYISATEPKKPTAIEVWGLGFLLVTVISLCSLLGALFLPFMDKEVYKQLLMILIGLAVGSLSASSVFHLIPQAFQLVDNDSHHSYLNISLMLWAGIWVFFMTERIMKILTNARHNKRHAEAEGRFRDMSTEVVSAVSSPSDLLPGQELEENPGERHILSCSSTPCNYQDQILKPSYVDCEVPRGSHSHTHHIHFEQGKDSVIATVAWMIIFGDGLHNFIDGLSIGAAFNESILTGISISVAVMCEELPHELGDFAVLLNAGMTMRQALVYNFLSACTCYLGLILGILLGKFEASNYIFGFAAGMFMYISLVDMMPELNAAAEEASKVEVKTAIKTLALQNIGMCVGVVALYLLARFQDSITFM